MSNLLSSLLASTSALNAFDRVLNVVQNNVANSSTPGYAKQTQNLVAMQFEATAGDTGGVRAGTVASSRDEYAEQAVRRSVSAQSEANQKVYTLTSVQSVFDVSGSSGISSALSNLYSAFSAWGSDTSSAVARQNVIERATNVATAFQNTATALDGVARDTEQQIRNEVDQVNALTKQLQSYNKLNRNGSQTDAGLDAQVHSTLESLSQLVNFTTLKQADGSYTVLMNGQVPLVTGDNQYDLTPTFTQATASGSGATAPASAKILASDGTDVTAQVSSGELGALVDLRNNTLAELIGDSSQAGTLNILAKGFADRVNTIMESGVVSAGPPQVMGSPLFTYDATNDTTTASTLAVNSAITASDLAATDSTSAASSNGIPLQLSALATPTQDIDRLKGFSFTEYYASLASKVGSALSDATNESTVQTSLVAQAKELRTQLSGVSLDEEATILIQFQRGYQANARLLTVLDGLTEDIINIIK